MIYCCHKVVDIAESVFDTFCMIFRISFEDYLRAFDMIPFFYDITRRYAFVTGIPFDQEQEEV